MTQRDSRILELFKKLGLPNKVHRLMLHMNAGEVVVAHCTFYPESADGGYLLEADGDALKILAEDFVLVRRDAFAELPEWIQAKIAVRL